LRGAAQRGGGLFEVLAPVASVEGVDAAPVVVQAAANGSRTIAASNFRTAGKAKAPSEIWSG
jgi:hypothetical protein